MILSQGSTFGKLKSKICVLAKKDTLWGQLSSSTVILDSLGIIFVNNVYKLSI